MSNKRYVKGTFGNTNQAGGVNAAPEKLYTQNEVNELLDDQSKENSALAKEVLSERRVSDKRKRLDKKTVKNLVKQSNRILASISSHALPIDLFPDTINVEEGRVTIITRHFLSSEVHSIDIKNISNIFINTSILFSQLVIISKTFEENEIRVRNLLPRQAVHIRRIIEGLRVFIHNKIDMSAYSVEELVSKLEELSKTKIET
jgi:hypothetical protein